METLTGFDIVALIVLLLSILIAVARGFIREALTVAAFVIAALGALWARPVVVDVLAEYVGSELIASIIALSVVFLVIYLALAFIFSALGLTRRNEPVHPLDRLLGVFFGAARGLILLGLGVLVFQTAVPGAEARWMTEARMYPLAESVADMLRGLAPEGSWAQGAPENASPADSPDAEDRSERLDPDALDRLIRSTSEDEPG